MKLIVRDLIKSVLGKREPYVGGIERGVRNISLKIFVSLLKD